VLKVLRYVNEKVFLFKYNVVCCQSISLGVNEFDTIDGSLFEHLPNIVELDLTCDRRYQPVFTTINDGAFKFIPKVKSLNFTQV
jgi:hypothetical protein